jgi:hypothetical protein
MSGLSPFFNHPPVTTSFVYNAGPFSDAGFQFVVQTTPEQAVSPVERHSYRHLAT